MRYAIYKLIFIVAMFLSFVSCESSQINNFNFGYYVGIVSFNKSKKVSYINQFNENGKESNKIKFSVQGMGYLHDFIPSDDEKFYVKSSDILSMNGKNFLIEVDKFTNRYSKIELDVDDIYKIFNDKDFLYITHSINKISRYDKKKGKIVNTCSVDDYIVSEVYLSESEIYAFSRIGKEKSFLNILDKKSLKVIKRFEVTNFGIYQNDIFYDNGKLYFTNYDAFSKSDIGKIGIYDIVTQSFDFISVNSRSLDRIIVSGDKIYLTVKGNSLKDSLLIVDRNTLKIKKKGLDYSVKVFDIIDDKIFILSDKLLEIYDAHKFELFKRIKISIDKDSVVSGLIVYD